MEQPERPEAGYRDSTRPPATTFRFRPGLRVPVWSRAIWAVPIGAVVIGVVAGLISRSASVACTRGRDATLVCKVDESELGFHRWHRELRIEKPESATAAQDPASGDWIVSVYGAAGAQPLTRVSTGNRGDALFVADRTTEVLTGKLDRAESGYTYTGLRELVVLIGGLLLLALAAFGWELSRRASIVIDPASARVRLPRSRARKHERTLPLRQIGRIEIERRGVGSRIVLELTTGEHVPLAEAFHFGTRRQLAFSRALATALRAFVATVADPSEHVAPPAAPRVIATVAALMICVGLVMLSGAPQLVLPPSENLRSLLQLIWTIPATALLAGLVASVSFLIRRKGTAQSAAQALMLWALLVTPFSGWGLVRLLNVGLDRSAGIAHASRFVRHIHRAKGPDTIEIADWNDPAGTITLDTSWVPYDKQAYGLPLRVTTRHGLLGIEWVSSVELVAGP